MQIFILKDNKFTRSVTYNRVIEEDKIGHYFGTDTYIESKIGFAKKLGIV